jgi:SAM-dependent methyltransferase
MFAQDFNEPVLRMAAAPNVRKNVEALSTSSAENVKFVDGDFESACTLLASKPDLCPFDIVLTSESIYNDRSAQQILDGCDQCLATNGCVYVAAKSHYFGVAQAGGLAKFKRMVDQDGRFCWEVTRRADDGMSNVREVLLLKRTSH